MRGTFRVFVAYLACDVLATAGAVITSTTAIVFLTTAFASFSNPYFGIVVFAILPALFLFGLILIPLGVWRCSRRVGGLQNIPDAPASAGRATRILGIIAMLTVVNIAVISAASYQGVQYMDSNEFCGKVCHTVMMPQYTAYQDFSHSRVHCVDCHIGPGAQSFVHYKLSGIRQLVSVSLGTYHRPVSAAVHRLRPAQETCEQCHSPAKFISDKLRVIRRYDEDEKNSEKVTVLLMHVGTRIHKAHVGRNIEYVASDPNRQDIPWVSVDGVEYKAGNLTGERRKMDCMDCHNRPAHAFDMAAPAVDKALESGDLDRSIAYAKRDAVLALTGKKSMDSAPPAVKKIFARNIWPEMSITWGSYPNNIGHDSFPGCFRCHDDNHKNSSGKTITQECTTCHELLAVGEDNPEILKQLGITH